MDRAVYAAKELGNTTLTLNEIGKFFGGRNHATISASNTRHIERYGEGERKSFIEEVRRRL
jgi:chromosomal replication initiation ATPase DnaA